MIADPRPHALIAVDLTDSDAETFVNRAVSWVEAISGTGDLVFVDDAASDHPYVLDSLLRKAMSVHYDDWHASMKRRLEALLSSQPPSVRGKALVIRGAPAPTLLSLLPEYDVVIVGNRPVVGLERLVHGVVAERIARRSSKPVIILPRA